MIYSTLPHSIVGLGLVQLGGQWSRCSQSLLDHHIIKKTHVLASLKPVKMTHESTKTGTTTDLNPMIGVENRTSQCQAAHVLAAIVNMTITWPHYYDVV